MTQVTIAKQGASSVTISGSSSQSIVASGIKPSLTVSENNNTIILQKPSSKSVAITETVNSVDIIKPSGHVIEITTAGPQGPPFAGSQYFDISAIGALTSGDNGTLLAWSGNVFVPTTQLLSSNLTIAGGAF